MDIARWELRPTDVIDLHCHSTASDGVLPPAEVVAAAAAIGLTALALTDHDTTAGLHEARAAGKRLSVEIIGGCEFSVGVPWGEMHLLGYFIEPGDHNIEVKAPGRAVISQHVDITPGQSVTVTMAVPPPAIVRPTPRPVVRPAVKKQPPHLGEDDLLRPKGHK